MPPTIKSQSERTNENEGQTLKLRTSSIQRRGETPGRQNLANAQTRRPGRSPPAPFSEPAGEAEAPIQEYERQSSSIIHVQMVDKGPGLHTYCFRASYSE